MTENLFLTEILFTIIIVIAGLVLVKFIRSKDGMLRKLMIGYFAIEIFVYFSSALYFWAIEKTDFKMSIDLFRVLAITPKAIMMLLLYSYLSKNK